MGARYLPTSDQLSRSKRHMGCLIFFGNYEKGCFPYIQVHLQIFFVFVASPKRLVCCYVSAFVLEDSSLAETT
jgi:hypothetical protein